MMISYKISNYEYLKLGSSYIPSAMVICKYNVAQKIYNNFLSSREDSSSEI